MKAVNIKRFLLSITVLVLISACSGGSGAKKAVEQYIKALQGGDFATIYDLHAITQKKVALIYRGDESGRDEALKENFEEYNATFAEAEPDSRLWSEKFLFPADATFVVTRVAIEDDKDQGTARFKDRKVAIADIKVSYGSREKAPDHASGKIKTATYVATFINGYDVVKGIKRKEETNISDWLFKSIRLDKDAELSTW